MPMKIKIIIAIFIAWCMLVISWACQEIIIANIQLGSLADVLQDIEETK